MESDYKGQSLLRLEKHDFPLDTETLIGFPIKIEEPDDESSSAPSGSILPFRIKTENSCDENCIDYNDIKNEELKGEILEQDEEEEISDGEKYFRDDWTYKYRGFYEKLGMMVADEQKPTSYLCEFCGYHRKTSWHFFQHYSTHFDISMVLYKVCPHCGIKIRLNNHLKYHIENVHSDFKRYLCDKCDFTTNYNHSFREHQITHTIFRRGEKVYYKCDLCNYESKKKSAYDSHKKIHIDASDLDMFKCHLCRYESKRPTNLKNHMLRHKKITETKSYDCELCAYKTKYPHLLRGHIKTNHQKFPKSLVRQCNECDFQTNNKYSLETHVKREHKKPPKTTDIKKTYKCDKCPFTTRFKTYLKTHALIHQDITERILFECYNCGIKYSSKVGLKSHIILKHMGIESIDLK